MNIIQVPSPNFAPGRGAYKPELIVIHVMAGTLAGTDDWFRTGSATAGNPVSSHYGVGHSGEIHKYVTEANTAWHAGRVSNPSFKLYKPNVNPNLYTIGIEHEGNDLSVDGTPAQKAASAALIYDICTRYGIPVDRDHVIGHYQVFDQKPNCPATNKNVIDELIKLAKPATVTPIVVEEQVAITVPKSKLDKITKYLLNL